MLLIRWCSQKLLPSQSLPLPLVLAEAATTAVFVPAPHPLVPAEAADPAVFAPAPLPLVLADAAAAAVLCRWRTEQEPCGASWLQKDVVPVL